DPVNPFSRAVTKHLYTTRPGRRAAWGPARARAELLSYPIRTVPFRARAGYNQRSWSPWPPPRGASVSAVAPPIHIVGIGSAGLTARARELVTSADLLLGADNALDLLPEGRGERVRIGPDLQEVVRLLEANLGRRRIAIVAVGDPLFYGVARYLCDRLGKEHFDVLPHVSSMQLAFARVKESWEEAFLTNLAGHPLETVLDR